METASEVPVVHLPALDAQTPTLPEGSSVTVGPWSPVELPRGRRPSPTTIAVVAVLAGIGAMALGAAAVVSAGRSDERTTTVVDSRPAAADVSRSEQAALSLLAKPSTQRVAFRHAGGRMLLAVGSSGRAAILLRGLARAAPGTVYSAWALRPGARPLRVARFRGTEQAVFLSRPLGPHTSVAVAVGTPGTAYPKNVRLVAVRG